MSALVDVFDVDIYSLPVIDSYASYQRSSETCGKEEREESTTGKSQSRRSENRQVKSVSNKNSNLLGIKKQLITTIPPPRLLQMGKRELTYEEIVSKIRLRGIDVPDEVSEYIAKLDPNKSKSRGGYTTDELKVQCEEFGLKKSGAKPALCHALIEQVKKLSAISQ